MTSGNRFLIDSSAWIEYLEATPSGAKASKIIEGGKNTIITPNIVMAEVVSKVIRKGGNHEIAVNAIQTLSKPATEEWGDFIRAGKEHAKLKERIKGISLADAIILTLAEKNRAAIVTKDSHIKGSKTLFIG